jgi:hypothetical protein
MPWCLRCAGSLFQGADRRHCRIGHGSSKARSGEEAGPFFGYMRRIRKTSAGPSAARRRLCN